jgi:hypothetical protein
MKRQREDICFGLDIKSERQMIWFHSFTNFRAILIIIRQHEENGKGYADFPKVYYL